MLEGPTFSLGWVSDGTIHTPGLDSHILESVTRGAVFDVAASLGIPVLEGSYPTAELMSADEVFVMSTVREVSPVHRLDDIELAPGPVTEALAHGFTQLVEAERP